MDGPSQRLRRHALQKIALLSANYPTVEAKQSDFAKLFRACSPPHSGPNAFSNGPSNTCSRVTRAPISLSELEILLALCKAGPLIDNIEAASRHLEQISPYLVEAHAQAIAPSPFLRSIEPSPWEALAYHLVRAVLVIGIKYPSLHVAALTCTLQYLHNCLDTIKFSSQMHHDSEDSASDVHIEETHGAAIISVSLLGFLEAASIYANFYRASEQLEIVRLLRQIMSEDFMVSVEGVFSSIRTSDTASKDPLNWKSYTKRYAAMGRPFGAMLLQRGFMRLLLSFSSLLISNPEQLSRTETFDILISDEALPQLQHNDDTIVALLEVLSDVAVEGMRLLEDGADYLQLGSAWQQRLAFTVKAYALNIYLNCMVVDEEIANLDTLLAWLEDSIADSVQMAESTLAYAVLKSMVVAARFSSVVASTFGRSLPRFIVQGGIQGETVTVAARCLTYILRLLSHDAVITGLYSLGNVLIVRANADKLQENGLSVPDNGGQNGGRYGQHSTGSAISLDLSGEEETAAVYGNIIGAIIGIASNCKDEKITALALSMLLQKLGKIGLAVDLHIITEAAILATIGGVQELRSLLKLYSKISYGADVQGNSVLVEAVLKARLYLSKSFQRGSSFYEIYQIHLLDSIIAKGDVHESDNTHQADIELAARQIGHLLQPLTCLVSSRLHERNEPQDGNIADLYREAWFNIVVHGITPSSIIGKKYSSELQILAMQSMPLIAEDRADQFESEIELNTVLRRGMNPPHVAEQKRRLISLLPRCESDIKALSYPKVIFLSAAYLVETLRADAGVCHHIMTYFLDPSLNGSAMENCMVAISDEVSSIYLMKTLSGQKKNISTPLVANELALIFASCCHRSPRVQQVATASADEIIRQIPSSLCHRTSLFALLELLTIMWTSCLEAEIDEYNWKSSFVSSRGEVSVDLSDNYQLRKSTLNNFHKRARTWVTSVINIAPMDVKGLLQTYLSEYDDNGAYGHVALGRSFALDMGFFIPLTDQKLGAIERHGDWNVNTASDFVAQYTTRQEYKYADALPEYDREWASFLHRNDGQVLATNDLKPKIEDDQALLTHLERRSLDRKFVSIGELRDVLRRAAALLSRAKKDHSAIVHHLVSIPFAMFTKQSIKLGISLWLGLINENPRLESMILADIAENWEMTVRNHMGIFSTKLFHPDPFYIKKEFAPSDKNTTLKRQEMVQNLIAPHLRILQFLVSHFSATRLVNPHIQAIFHRLTIVTLEGLGVSAGQPLAREIHFRIILLGLSILQFCTGLDQAARWRLKDLILSAALRWFSHPPRWSFGGNRLQIKAEARLMEDVDTALRDVASIGSQANDIFHSLVTKQDLLHLLIDNEQTRLEVWLYPLDHERRHFFPSRHASKTPLEANISTLLRSAWSENSSLAIQLSARFQSAKLYEDIRGLLLNIPEKALDEPGALEILLGSALPVDVSFQLKYLLYWTSVNPVTAVTYFLPEYGNHPFVLQYAMRALESHSVDVTFFYVPQIVQTLRYDTLGYVQRYIIETAKFSQLFAHQIIWNMKANAYKDEESSIEDSLKPTLDVVTNNMIHSFSKVDKAFYEREFSFFNEITEISGKLRPFIKKSKPEKKQKIEEELRKIKVEVGVYLPSNPDGTVIGIDRKSGKPLQSHAKAPYMATFRIKKNRGEMEGTEILLENTNRNLETDRTGFVTRENTYEVWQSAIFKVGDDCRQDVLALQLIAAFRGIFNDVGLDVYVYPYRVTATAPGCGVIDVLPNSISRDMLGREAVNGLYDYFISKYGAENSIRFQEARNNFIKSMAAYSVISYLLQFKDRHNGNIMINDAGHILHIDFGFCFDIAPGGVRFERAPFKLTSEMVAVMGGSTSSQSYKWFEELCIKAFLASRQHTKKLCDIVVLMLGSGLPCFKPDTIAHLRERFVLEKSEREAADFMKDLIKKSHGSYSTKGYDQFQLITNGIPY